MVERMTLSERDVRTMLRIVCGPDDGGSANPLPMPIVLALFDLVRCDTVTLAALDAERRESLLDQNVGASDGGSDWESLVAAFWKHYWGSPPCVYPDVSGYQVTVTKVSDFHTTGICAPPACARTTCDMSTASGR